MDPLILSFLRPGVQIAFSLWSGIRIHRVTTRFLVAYSWNDDNKHPRQQFTTLHDH